MLLPLPAEVAACLRLFQLLLQDHPAMHQSQHLQALLLPLAGVAVYCRLPQHQLQALQPMHLNQHQLALQHPLGEGSSELISLQ